ncbi:hypothetical protein [Halobellus rufus]|uniref:hypothetical protein n=1 Tax=Halobellus rufus TaxID=1448860 RepID=UPI0006786EAA|nr:hypothetical protein [Halobellus rufus]
MQRRKFITAIGTLAVGTGMAMGTSAFTTTSAERSFSVSTADDDSGLLSLDVGTGEVADPIVDNSSGNGTISFTFNNINREAYTTFDGLLEVTNLDDNYSRDITKLTFTPLDSDEEEVTPDDSPVKVYRTGTDPVTEDTFSLSGIDNSISDFDGDGNSLGPGESIQVGFVIDTTVTDHDTIETIENIIISATTPGSDAN